MSRAFVFPGQGAQTIGMGRALAEAYPTAQAVFDEVDEALGEKLSALIWEGEADDLTLTANAQPALMATSLAAQRALEAPLHQAGQDLAGAQRDEGGEALSGEGLERLGPAHGAAQLGVHERPPGDRVGMDAAIHIGHHDAVGYP